MCQCAGTGSGRLCCPHNCAHITVPTQNSSFTVTAKVGNVACIHAAQYVFWDVLYYALCQVYYFLIFYYSLLLLRRHHPKRSFAEEGSGVPGCPRNEPGWLAGCSLVKYNVARVKHYVTLIYKPMYITALLYLQIVIDKTIHMYGVQRAEGLRNRAAFRRVLLRERPPPQLHVHSSSQACARGNTSARPLLAVVCGSGAGVGEALSAQCMWAAWEPWPSPAAPPFSSGSWWRPGPSSASASAGSTATRARLMSAALRPLPPRPAPALPPARTSMTVLISQKMHARSCAR